MPCKRARRRGMRACLAALLLLSNAPLAIAEGGSGVITGAVKDAQGKAIRFGATAKLDVMAQAFNLFNTRNLQAQYGGGRVTNALSDTFGRILTARPGRQAELAMRLAW